MDELSAALITWLLQVLSHKHSSMVRFRHKGTRMLPIHACTQSLPMVVLTSSKTRQAI